MSTIVPRKGYAIMNPPSKSQLTPGRHFCIKMVSMTRRTQRKAFSKVLFSSEWVLFTYQPLDCSAYVLACKAFKHIFTSPSSAAETRPDEESPPEPLYKRSRTQGERRTWSDVATLLGMWSVQPRAIAYSAVQVHSISFLEMPDT